LIALLRAVAYGWRQERLAENAQAISALGQELYGRLRTLAGHFEKLGGQLDRAVATYNEAVGSFERSVLSAARRFKDKGIGAGEEIPLVESIDRTTRGLQTREYGSEVENIEKHEDNRAAQREP
jgi:DNA recombination protein RmuC